MTDSQENRLQMKFSPRTIEHLGIQMYSTLPPVLCELVSNAYDADAERVDIYLKDEDRGNKRIEIIDDGNGMSFSEINEKYLVIGRNRRHEEGTHFSRNKRRPVIGKKGLGKLAFFGIANTVIVETVQDNKKTSFELDWDAIKSLEMEENEYYHPKIIGKNELTDGPNGTKLLLKGIRRKSPFPVDLVAYSIAKNFQILNLPDFAVWLHHNDDEPFRITNEMKYDAVKPICEWDLPANIPESLKGVLKRNNQELKGKLIASVDTVSADMRGIALFSRGKLASNYGFLDVNSSSHGYSYITGWIDISFIEDFERDVISTNRQSLNWENEDLVELKDCLETLYKSFFNHQKDCRVSAKRLIIEDSTGIQLDPWFDSLPRHEKSLAKKIIDTIITAEGIDDKKTIDLVSYTQDSFQFESFKEMAREMENLEVSSPEKLISFFSEWEIVEAKEMYKIALIRIETIRKFKEHIDRDSREVPEVHNFLKQFPWLLDPRIMNFKDEVTYSKLLREKFIEDDTVIEQNRRIDFLCQNFAGSFFIIELKRPGKTIGEKELFQALQYSSFIGKNISNESSQNIVCYIIGKSLSQDPSVQTLSDSLRDSSKVIVKTYSELLQTAINYHEEFIQKYNASGGAL